MNLRKDEGKRNVFLETILAIAISVVYMLVVIYYIPELMFLYPVYFIILGIRHGINYNVTGLLISALIIGMVVDMVFAISIIIAFAPLSIVLNYTIERRRKSLEIISSSTLLLFISFLIIMIVMKGVTGISLINQLEERLAQLLDGQMNALKNMDLSSYEMLKIGDGLEGIVQYTILIMPSIMIIFSLAIAYINYLISVLILRRWGYGIVSIPRFSRLQLPSNILLGTGIMFIGAFILKGLKLFYYETILLNITVLIFFIFFIQGLSVVDYKLIAMKFPIFLRGIIIILLMVLLPFGWIISIIGLLDVIIDFRKLGRTT
ncbi:MAG: DUF2232 domain-containing protein [Tissierellia bacterium]|nr:DUF2232 domain-containing protein [Tissierellia bacterium]